MFLQRFFFLGGNEAVVLQEGLGDGLDDLVVLADQGQRVVGYLSGAFVLVNLDLGQLNQFCLEPRHFLKSK